MSDNTQHGDVKRRDFVKMLGGLGAGFGVSGFTMLANREKAFASDGNDEPDIRSKLNTIDSPIQVDEKRYERFNQKNLAYNLLSRETNQNCVMKMFQKGVTYWKSGQTGYEIPEMDPEDARTMMAFMWGANSMNVITGAFGEGEENKGALSWTGEIDFVDEHFNHHFPPPTMTDPAKLTRLVKQMARLSGADLVGICRFNKKWIYSEVQRNPMVPDQPITKKITFEDVDQPKELADRLIIPSDVSHAVVMGYEQARLLGQTSPSILNMAASGLGYSRMGFSSVTLANYIRAQGYWAIPCKNGVGPSVPFAIEAGLGQDGRSGLLITPEFGPNVRLDKVLTNMPLVPDKPIDLGVYEFCNYCKKCARECPSKAISMADRTWEGPTPMSMVGVYKWYNDHRKCLSFWMENGNNCGNCVAVCPFTKGDFWTHKLTEWTIKNIPVADGLWLTLDDAFHYGERRDANEVLRDVDITPYGIEKDKFAKSKL